MPDNSRYVAETQRIQREGVRSPLADRGLGLAGSEKPSWKSAADDFLAAGDFDVPDPFMDSNPQESDPDLGESPSQFEPETPESDETTGETIPEDDLADLEPLPAPGAASEDAPPGVYGAPGDPYSYQVNPDGTVTLLDGPTGKGMTLSNGAALAAIKGQIKSGTLKQGVAPTKKAAAPPAAPAPPPPTAPAPAMRSPSPQAANRIKE